MDDPSLLTEEELDRRLVSGEDAEALRAYFGDALYDELRLLARRAQDAPARRGSDGQVYLLPGIMGSKLSVVEQNDTDLIWLNPFALRRGRVAELVWPSERFHVTASGVFHFAYQRMRLRLLVMGHSVRILPYDWRSGIEGIADALWPSVANAEGPVSLICHSMGGLVGRALAARDSTRKIRHVVTLGTPNLGSYAPVTVLRGLHKNVQMLGRIDTKRTARELVDDIIRHYPGLLEMLPSPTRRPEETYFDTGFWPPDSIVPETESLAAAGAAQAALAPPDARFVQIVGLGHDTLQRARRDGDTLVFYQSPDGDGTVPRDLAEMEGAGDRYYVEAKHGAMCNMLSLIRACDAVLEGRKPQLATAPDRVRGAEPAASRVDEKTLQAESRRGLPRSGDPEKSAITEQLLLEGFLSDEADADPDALPDGPPPPPLPPDMDTPGEDGDRSTYVYTRQKRALRRINVDVLLANILDVPADAYVLGVFEGVQTLGGAAGAVDAELGGMLSALMGDGQITGRKGEVIFIPVPRHHLRTSHIVVVGLGAFGDPGTICGSVRVAAHNLMRSLCISSVHSFACVLLGAGSGPEPVQIFRSLFSGIFDALTDWDADHGFSRISICEMQEASYEEILTGLNRTFAEFNMPDCEIVVQQKRGVPGLFTRRSHPASRTRQPDIFTVRADLSEEETGDPLVSLSLHHVPGSSNSRAQLDESRKTFRLSELDAVMEPLAQALTPAELVPHAQAVEELVLHHLFRDNLRFDHESECGLQIICDQWASRVPWEVLHLGGPPIALGGGISRWYLPARSGVRRATRRHGAAASGAALRMLLVADPTEDLRGARAEYRRIRETVRQQDGVTLEDLYQGEATLQAVEAALRQTEAEKLFDIFHYAGHAFFDPSDRARSGLILQDDRTLRGSDIAEMVQIPGFVFLNACESVRVRRGDGDTERASPQAYAERNAGLAEAFLTAGVRHIVGTFWPVPDATALDFAAAFYGQLPEARIGPALTHARNTINAAGSADWINYIHYGAAGDRI